MASATKYEEWFSQSDYDLETAVDMFGSKRYGYAIFMCHLCLEKALKGLFIKLTHKFPSKTHDLMYFVGLLDLKMNESDIKFVVALNSASIPTRYPESLRSLFSNYTKENANNTIAQTKSIQQWIKQQ